MNMTGMPSSVRLGNSRPSFWSLVVSISIVLSQFVPFSEALRPLRPSVLTLERSSIANGPSGSSFQSRRDGYHPLRRDARLSGWPDEPSFLSHAYHSAAHVGNFLYIDGGEINFLDGNGKSAGLPDNYTYSIDVSKSWTPSSVTINNIPKSAPVMNYVSMWTDRVGSAIYAFGGEQSMALRPAWSPALPPTSIWKFLPDAGSGTWTEVTTSTDFEGIVRPAAGLGASGARVGVLLGGYTTARTSSDSGVKSGFLPTPGLVMFNYTTQTWSNRSATGYSQFGTAQYGQASVVSGFGDHDVFAFFGGETSNLVAWKDTGSNLVSFKTVKLYDPFLDRWYQQTATGQIPEPRDRFCSIGVPGDNGTYEIFIFGGHVASSDGTEPQASASDAQKVRNTALDQVFVLSMPGFVWKQADYTAAWPRIDHTCTLVGKRQMVVVGGLNPALNNLSELVSTKDPWTNGIGIFDLTDMTWKDSYNAGAANYTTPDVVKNWYASNGMYPSNWDNQALGAYFMSVDSSSNSTGSGSSTNSTSTSGDGGQASSTTNPSPSSSTGAIAGGVVGGIVAIALIAALVYFLRRRRNKRQTPPIELQSTQSHFNHTPKQKFLGQVQEIGTPYSETGSPNSTLPAYNSRSGQVQMKDSNEIVEMPTEHRVAKSGRNRFEMPG